jgi:hypothetical protein
LKKSTRVIVRRNIMKTITSYLFGFLAAEHLKAYS